MGEMSDERRLKDIRAYYSCGIKGDCDVCYEDAGSDGCSGRTVVFLLELVDRLKAELNAVKDENNKLDYENGVLLKRIEKLLDAPQELPEGHIIEGEPGHETCVGCGRPVKPPRRSPRRPLNDRN